MYFQHISRRVCTTKPKLKFPCANINSIGLSFLYNFLHIRTFWPILYIFLDINSHKHDLNHPWDAPNEGKATKHNRKTKQHNTTHPRQLFFKEKTGIWTHDRRLLGIGSYQLTYRGSSAGWAQIKYPIQSNQSTSTKASQTRYTGQLKLSTCIFP